MVYVMRSRLGKSSEVEGHGKRGAGRLRGQGTARTHFVSLEQTLESDTPGLRYIGLAMPWAEVACATEQPKV